MEKKLWDDRSVQEQAKTLRKALAEAYGSGEMQKALHLSRKLDALQLSLWKVRGLRRPA